MDPKLRERLGEEVRLVWINWARQQPNPKPTWLTPWRDLAEPDKEVDRQIGERLFRIGEAFASPTQSNDGSLSFPTMNKHTFTLANGDEISVSLCESGYGVEGYRLKISAMSGNLVVRPNADNALTVSTEKAAFAEDVAKTESIRAREAVRAAKATPQP